MSEDWSQHVRVLSPEDLVEGARARGLVEGYRLLAAKLPGRQQQDRFAYASEQLGLPDHLSFALQYELAEREGEGGELPTESHFTSIPFHDLCYGLLLPLDGLSTRRSQRMFGLRGPYAERLDSQGRRRLVSEFLAAEAMGLDLIDKVALVRGDPFLGRNVGTSLNVLLDVLAQVVFRSPNALRDDLGSIGDVQELFVRHCNRPRSDPPLTTREVLLSLRHLKGSWGRRKRRVLRSLVERMGRLEVFFLIGFLRRGRRVTQTLGDEALLTALADASGLDRARLDLARSLVDVFELARIVRDEGAAGLAALALRPLSPVGPMLAGPEVPKDQAFPVFFEKKYDGIRLMIHKARTHSGRMRVAAYTRRRHDWTDQIPGVERLAYHLPCQEVILDGELHGTFFTEIGPRPASVYDVMKHVRGEGGQPLKLMFTAFDVIFLDGQDLTERPFVERRQVVQALVGGLTGVPLPLPVELSDGELVAARTDLMRLYNLFRAQGYEGGIAKDPRGLYELGRRSDSWTKLKPAITLDLAITGALHTTSAQGPGATFGSYLVSALAEGPSLQEVGRVAGLGAQDSARLIQSILDDGLLTGRRLERETSSGRKAGVELRAGIVASIRFEGVVRDEKGKLSLRDPKILRVRTGEKDLGELDTVKEIERLFQKQRFA
ncbi:MAG: hypothetical protein JKY65_26690 [Planctomycetes bacterium]|nr:hypothetical protein [Planctomycetota bacterium]